MHKLKTRLRVFYSVHPVLSRGLVILFLFGILLAIMNPPYRCQFPSDQITRIDLVDVQEPVDLYSYDSKVIPDIILNASTVCVELDRESIQGFLKDFSGIQYGIWENDPCPHIQDGTILITYADGSLEWICARGTFYQNHSTGKAGMTWYYFDENSFTQLLQTYGFH